jgi:hypothetical protein
MKPGLIATGLCLTMAGWTATAGAWCLQDSSSALRTATLEVRTDCDSARVYLDSVYIGRTPLVLDSLVAGNHFLRIIPPRPEDWSAEAVSDTVNLVPERVNSFTYPLLSFVSLTSIPSGASLYINDSLAGVTPLLLKPKNVHPGSNMMLKMPGFEPAGFGPEAFAGTAFQVALKAGWQQRIDEETPFINGASGWNTRKIGLYVSGGVSVLAGVAAAYFKIAADEKQSAFMETGDVSLLSDRRRLDTWAGISLAATQVGLAVLSYLLITE